MLGADAERCSLASGQGRYSHNVWNRQEALRLQRQVAAAEKAAERERKLQETGSGKAQAERLNADLEARIARLESILRRGLDQEAAIDLNAMLRTDDFPPLDLRTDGVAAPRPIWSAPTEPGLIAGFFGGKSRHDSDWLRPVRCSNGQNWSTNELRWPVKSEYGNKPHAMRQLCWRIRMTSPAITAASHKSLLA